jgi:hypothetical protein
MIVADHLVGRHKLIGTVLAHLRRGRSVCLIGPPGIGKSAILRAVAARAGKAGVPCRPIYCEQGATLKSFLTALARQLSVPEAGWDTGEAAARGRLSVGKLKRLVLPRLRSERYALLLDHFGLVRGAYATFLEKLTDRAKIPVVLAARSLDPRESGKLWWIAVGHATVAVPPLSPGEARRLIERCLEKGEGPLPDREAFIGELVRTAHGNPGVITRICEMAASGRYQIGGRTDFRLLLLDRAIEDVQARIDAESRVPLRGPVSLMSESSAGP